MAKRSRRLRKKLMVDEFQVLGFSVSFDFHPDHFHPTDGAAERTTQSENPKNIFCLQTLAAEYDDLFDRFVVEAIEANDLACGGGGSFDKGVGSFGFFVLRSAARGAGKTRTSLAQWLSASEDDRCAVVQWLGQQHNVANVVVGGLVDANVDTEESAA